jgi:2TM domain
MDSNISLKDYQKAFRGIVIKEQKIGFVVHSICYVIVNTGLIFLNLSRSPGYKWFYWPLICWCFGLAMHFIFGVVLQNRFLKAKERLAEKHVLEGLGT